MASEQDKLNREVYKLDREIAVLERPFWKTPTGVAALLATVVALVGTGVQYLNSTVDKKLAEIERLKIVIAIQELAQEKARTEQELARLREERVQLNDDKNRLEQQYLKLTTFFRDNPNIENASALLSTIRSARYPLTFKRTFRQRDNLTVTVAGLLTEAGALTVTVSATGSAKISVLALKGYKVAVTDLQSGDELATFSIEALKIPAAKVLFGIGVFEWRKKFEFTVDQAAATKVFLDSQWSITELK